MKVKAKTSCLISYDGKAWRVKEGEILNLDIPEDRMDLNSFEILEKVEKIVKKEKRVI